jgi:hypothetical protein
VFYKRGAISLPGLFLICMGVLAFLRHGILENRQKKKYELLNDKKKDSSNYGGNDSVFSFYFFKFSLLCYCFFDSL